MVGYDGLHPGPTFIMRKGKGKSESISHIYNFSLFLEAVVRFANRGPINISTHVHGQYNRAPFDGWASDYTYPSQYKDYHYPNAQNARTIWYHVSTSEHAFR